MNTFILANSDKFKIGAKEGKKSLSTPKESNNNEEEKELKVGKKGKSSIFLNVLTFHELSMLNAKRNLINFDLGTIFYGDFGTEPSEKIASFDMDSTLILTKSGKTFAKDASDWVWWNADVPKKIREDHKKGYKIVIISNQGGVAIGKTSTATLQAKFKQLHKAIGVPFQFFCACANDDQRKPNVAMWELLVKSHNGKKTVDMEASFYCGDAAGRPKTAKRGKDFSDSDRKFAINVGLPFKTPEMYFLNENEKLPPLDFDIRAFGDKKQTKSDSKDAEETKDTTDYKSDKQELIVFVGAAGAGKSTFWKNHLSDYVRVNNDTLKTKEVGSISFNQYFFRNA